MPRGRPRKDGSNSSPAPRSCKPICPCLQSIKAPVKLTVFAAQPKQTPSQRLSLPNRQSRRNVKEIKNSSDVEPDLMTDALNTAEGWESEHDPLSAKRSFGPQLQVKKETLKEVMIPVSTFKKPRGRPLASRSPSSIGTALSSVRDLSTEYDTPDTSTVVTPAESLANGRGSLNRQHKPRRKPLPGVNKTSTASGKRKRNASKPADDDAALALTLQTQEYNEDHPVTNGKVSRAPVHDSDDSMDDVSDLSNEGFFPASGSPRKRPKLNARSSLPSRSAREVANKSIRQETAHQIQDSDESELSDVWELESDVESEESEGSEGVDEDVAAATIGSGANSIQPTTAGPDAARAARRANIRARRQVQRGRRGWEARMAERYDSRAALERAKLEKAHPEILTMWTTLKEVSRIVPEEAEQPSTITRKLKSFQLQGLDWMMKQEKSQWKGGLLGDEMGMGKTIQAVSLIMSDYPAKDPTLVVVPPVALMQWQNEIKEYTDGKLKVLVYHNTNAKVKSMKVKELREYDVIMISYSGLESIYRKESKGWKREDGIVKENSKIHAINYHRLILDEAHNIKTRTTGVARACFALNADYKWCLSGTPVQNRIGEFFSLLRFLEIRPFACYFCKACSCAELHWSQNAENKKCTKCNHSGFNHVSIFNQELLNPITQGSDNELRKEALGKLRLVTDRIMLRRMKRDFTASMELPPKEVIIHNEFFGEIERDFSTSIMSNTTRQFDTYVSRGVMLNNYANIFGLIMQMRQVANHPDLILKKHGEGGQNVLVCCICDETAEEPIRSRCHHEFCRKCAKDYVRSFEEAASPDCPRCHIPLAIDFDQPDIEQDEDKVKKSSIINRIKMEEWTSSTKIEMLVYDLYKLRSQKQTQKSIVFSQFTSMLQLVEWRLRRAGFQTVMLDGSMSPAQRQKSIEYFMNNTSVEVFLVSLKAGGVALNLTEASRVFIIDP